MIFKIPKAIIRSFASLSLKILDIRRAFRDRKTVTYSPTKVSDENDMENNPNIMAFRSAELKLGQIREENLGKDSEEEDDHLDYMDTIHNSLTEDEIHHLDYHPGPFNEYAIKYIK